jgi:molybdopterin-synthase adenylyltransferase
MSPLDHEIKERYGRQILFPPIGEKGQQKLLQSSVAVIGLGALGTVSCGSLARAGVGRLKLVDRDYVESSNLQRQVLFDEEDSRKVVPKAMAAVHKLKTINSSIEYSTLVDDVNYQNVEEIIHDVDLVLDATDNFETRFLVNEACVKRGIPWIYGSCVASYGITFSIIPGETACFSCYLGGMPRTDAAITCDTAGIIGPAAAIVASLQATEALKYLTGAKEEMRKNILFFDLWLNEFSELELHRDMACPVCVDKKFEWLSGKNSQHSTYLCGSNAVQVLPPARQKISLNRIKESLQPLGEVFASEYLLTFKTGPYELVIFPDGRALIKGTDNHKLARSLYARYVGT